MHMPALREDLRGLWLLVIWDLNRMKSRTLFVVMRVSWFALQVSLFGLALSAMVRFRAIAGTNLDYYHFYLFGIYTSMLFSISVSKAYDIAEEFEEGTIEYLLSLPFPRRVLALGRSIGGGVASFLFTLPMFAFIVYLLGSYDPVALTVSMISALAFSIGVVGFVLTVVLSLKSSDSTDIAFGLLDAILVRLSTVFYPALVLSKIAPYYYAALVNPLSHMSDLLRTIFFFEEFKAIAVANPDLMAAYVFGLAVGLSTLAVLVVEKAVEGGGWK
ncbi:ABC transporter permease [Infirmifilum uzonense]|jgi:ABC-2 type transport system permease protein|nr:ABC transporter permease [Infirmifilum uzonense]